jgi:hypothetical protein
MSGQRGTPEGNVLLPVAAYSYGSIVDPATNQITYQKTQSIRLPFTGAPVFTFGLTYTSAFPSAGGDSSSYDLISPQAWVDLNGDGRPDLGSELGLFRNTPGPNGTTAFSSPQPQGGFGGFAEKTASTGNQHRFVGEKGVARSAKIRVAEMLS